jgi:glycerol kinase
VLQASQACYCLEGSVFMAGATVQWLRDGLGIISRRQEVEALARLVPIPETCTWCLPLPAWDARLGRLMRAARWSA